MRPDGAAEAVGVLGGTFDPVHIGHLRTALEVLQACRLAIVRLMPCGVPAHRAPPVAPAQLRLRMLALAAASEPRFLVDDREVRRQGVSYSIDTLAELRAEAGTAPICLILGADAFLGLPSWKRWRELTDLAHLIVMQRPGAALPAAGELQDFLRARRANAVHALGTAPAGLIWLQPVSQLEISASAIRASVAAGGDPRFLVPDAVRDLILETRCYSEKDAQSAASTEVPVRA
jgi:nicotinate-nucleotide adenylyltransferase